MNFRRGRRLGSRLRSFTCGVGSPFEMVSGAVIPSRIERTRFTWARSMEVRSSSAIEWPDSVHPTNPVSPRPQPAVPARRVSRETCPPPFPASSCGNTKRTTLAPRQIVHLTISAGKPSHTVGHLSQLPTRHARSVFHVEPSRLATAVAPVRERDVVPIVGIRCRTKHQLAPMGSR